jgi:hypothetical protein
MANLITLKKSATPSQAPAALAEGEIAINYADGKLFYKNISNSIIRSSFNIFDIWDLKSSYRH